jgi:hypothetical protein
MHESDSFILHKLFSLQLCRSRASSKSAIIVFIAVFEDLSVLRLTGGVTAIVLLVAIFEEISRIRAGKQEFELENV